jgi:hypothetical protein
MIRTRPPPVSVAIGDDSDLNSRVERGGPNSLVFEPEIDWNEFKDPNIIDGYSATARVNSDRGRRQSPATAI